MALSLSRTFDSIINAPAIIANAIIAISRVCLYQEGWCGCGARGAPTPRPANVRLANVRPSHVRPARSRQLPALSRQPARIGAGVELHRDDAGAPRSQHRCLAG